MDPLSFASSALLALAEGTGVEGEVSCVANVKLMFSVISLRSQMVIPLMVIPPLPLLEHQLPPPLSLLLLAPL